MKERCECISLGGRQILSERGHVAVTLLDLSNELIAAQSKRHTSQIRPASSTESVKGMAVATLRVLQDDGPLQFKRGAVRHELRRHGITRPGLHVR